MKEGKYGFVGTLAAIAAILQIIYLLYKIWKEWNMLVPPDEPMPGEPDIESHIGGVLGHKHYTMEGEPDVDVDQEC